MKVVRSPMMLEDVCFLDGGLNWHRQTFISKKLLVSFCCFSSH